MEVDDEWDEVDKAFQRMEPHGVFQSTLPAMRRLVEMVKYDASFADVHPIVSLGAIMFSRSQAKRRVCVSWCGDEGYEGYCVNFVDPPLEFSQPTMAREDAVIRVLREYLNTLRAPD